MHVCTRSCFIWFFIGFARALKLTHCVLIHGVQQSFQHQTKEIGKNHETQCKIQHQIQRRNIKDKHNFNRLYIWIQPAGNPTNGNHQDPFAIQKGDRWRWSNLRIFHGLLHCAERAEVWICNFPTFQRVNPKLKHIKTDVISLHILCVGLCRLYCGAARRQQK